MKRNSIDKLDIIIQASIVGFVGSMPISIAFCQTALGIGCMSWLLKCLLQKKWNGFKTPFDGPLLLFLLACIIASVASSKQFDSFLSLKKFYLVTALYLTAYNVKSRGRIFELIWLFVAMTALTGVYGIIMNVFSYQPRLLAVQGMAMTSGGIFMIAALLCLALPTGSGILLKNKPVLIIISLVTIGSLMLTKTISAWLGFLSGIFAMFIHKKRLIIILIAVLAGLSVFFFLNQKKDDCLSYKKNSTWEARLTIWKIGWQIIKERPLLGTGLIDLGVLYQAKRSAEDNRLHGKTRRFGHLHNNFIHITATTGVVGLLTFVYLWIVICGFLIRLFKNAPDEYKMVSLSLLAIIIAFLVNGMAEWNFGDSEVVTIIWFILGLGIALKKFFESNSMEVIKVDNEKVI